MYANDMYVSPGKRRWQNGRTNGKMARRPHRSVNFEKYAAEGNLFVNAVANELGVDRNAGARITRSVLHAVRDRLPPVDAVQFAQGLPMAIKGVFFDQYDLSHAPVVIRHAEDFISYVRYLDHPVAMRDFPSSRHVEDAIAGVFRVLERTMDYGQVEQIKRMVNDDMAYLFY